MNRSQSLKQLRPILDLNNKNQKTTIELFQNEIIRPILKFQNDILIYRFENDTLTIKANFAEFNIEKKNEYIEERMRSDLKLQNEYIGMISGLFTSLEFRDYFGKRKELNRRIITMIVKRIKDNLSIS